MSEKDNQDLEFTTRVGDFDLNTKAGREKYAIALQNSNLFGEISSTQGRKALNLGVKRRIGPADLQANILNEQNYRNGPYSPTISGRADMPIGDGNIYATGYRGENSRGLGIGGEYPFMGGTVTGSANRDNRQNTVNIGYSRSFAKGGSVSLHKTAKAVAAQGRHGDNTLLHLNKDELHGIASLAATYGRGLHINPQTGYPEAFGLGSILKMAAIAAATINFGPAAGAAVSGGLTYAQTGKLDKSLLSAGMTYGLGSIGEGIGQESLNATANTTAAEGAKQAGETAAQEAFRDATKQQAADAGLLNFKTVPSSATVTHLDDRGLPLPNDSGSPFQITQNAVSQIPQGAPSPPNLTPKEVGDLAREARLEVYASMQNPPAPRMSDLSAGEKYDAIRAGYKIPGALTRQLMTPTGIGTLGAAGLTAYDMMKPQGITIPQNTLGTSSYRPMGATQRPVSFPEARYNPNTGEYNYFNPNNISQLAVGGSVPNMMQRYPQANVSENYYGVSPQSPDGAEVLSEYGPKIDPFTGEQRMAVGGIADFDKGTGDISVIRALRRYYPDKMAAEKAATEPGSMAQKLGITSPRDVRISYAFGVEENPKDYVPEQEKMAMGGGITYAASGRLLRGPGDGVSDGIPAIIQGAKPQKAALADGEFVLPARIVSEIGNGSTEAGARKLYAMMKRIQDRRGSTLENVAKDSKAENLLPA